MKIAFLSFLLLGAIQTAVANVSPARDLPLPIKAALQIAAQEEGRFVARGDGRSMAPLFGPDSVIIVQSASFDRITTGMVVVYRRADGKLVGHRAESKNGTAWTVRGIDNRHADQEQVTAANFVGILYGTLKTYGLTVDPEIWTTLPVVWGAPAHS